ncbi:MAG: TlpA family protein disulfide reductase [Candidatus Limnocylindrus sp.]
MRARALTLALIAALSFAGCQTSDELLGRRIQIQSEALLSEPSSSVSIGDLAQGDQRILLNFWGSWCVPCREEIPLFAEYEANGKSDGVLVGVLYKDAAGPGAAAATELGATWPTLLDEDGSIAAQIPVNAAPLTLLLDAAGRVLDYRVGPFVSLEEIDAFVSGE